jgi:hypothetical protein
VHFYQPQALSSSLWDVLEEAELIAEKRELSCDVHAAPPARTAARIASSTHQQPAFGWRPPHPRWHPTARRFVCWHQAPGGVQVVRTNGASPPQKSIRSTARGGGGLLCEPKPTSPQTSSPQLELCNARSAGRGAKSPTYRIPHREGLKQMFGDTAVDALRPSW